MAASILTRRRPLTRFESALLYALEFFMLASFCGYYLLPTGQANYFPSYFLGITVLALIGISEGVRQCIFESKLLFLAALFAAYLTATSLWSGDKTALLVSKALVEWLLVTTMLIGILVTIKSDDSAAGRLWVALVVAAAASAAFFLVSLVINAQAKPWGRISTPSVASMVYGFAAVIAISRAGVLTGVVGRMFFAVCATLLLAACYFCQTNYVWFGIASAMLSQVSFYAWERRHTTSVYLWSACLIVCLLLTAYSLESVISSQRQLIWKPIVTAAFASHPLFGNGILEHARPDVDCGASNWIQVHFAGCMLAHPHNVYISTLFYGGIVGISMLFLLILASFGYVFERNNSRDRAIVLALLTYSCAVLMFDGNKLLDKVDFMWLIFWLPIGMAGVLELTRDAEG